MNIVVVIPAYNEERTVGDVVHKICRLRTTGYRLQVLVVDDGSKDATAKIAREEGATVLSHPINRGLGAALSTGITAALRLGGDAIVTLDADDQHDPAEISRMIAPIFSGKAEVVIGSRFVARSPSVGDLATTMPLSRIGANFCGNMVTWILFGIWVSDSQSGFRAFSRAAAQKTLLRTSTMEVSSEIIKEIARNKFRFQEVPITVRYTEYSLSKGQGFLRGIDTLWKLIVLKFFR